MHIYNFIYHREINFLLSFHSQQGDDNQDLPQQERTIHPQPVQVSSSEATSEHPAYLPSGLGVSKDEEIKHLEERISILEEELQKEKCNHMEEVLVIKQEMSKVEQELNVARSQLEQTTRDKDNMADRLRAKEAEGCAKDAQLRAKQSELHAKDEQMKVKDEQGKAKDILLQAKDEHIKAKGAELCAKDDLLKTKESEVRTKDEQLKGKDEELSKKDEQLKQLRTTIEELEAKYAELGEQQKAKDNKASSHIEKLKTEKSQLEKELTIKKDAISKLKKAKDEAAESSQIRSALMHQVQGAESQIISSTSNTGECLLHALEHVYIVIHVAMQMQS